LPVIRQKWRTPSADITNLPSSTEGISELGLVQTFDGQIKCRTFAAIPSLFDIDRSLNKLAGAA
jgi:hypothetical protein